MKEDIYWMQEALKEAKQALKEGEVPVGAVIVKDGKIIGRGHNQTERLTDPTAHAEMIAITAASKAIGEKNLREATIYITIEPCVMCTGALILARVKRVVFGAYDEKFGGCGSKYNIPFDKFLNCTFEVVPGVLAEESKALLQEFFRKKRERWPSG